MCIRDRNLDPQMHVQQENNNTTVADEVDPELLAKVLANPEMWALLNSLAKTMNRVADARKQSQKLSAPAGGQAHRVGAGGPRSGSV